MTNIRPDPALLDPDPQVQHRRLQRSSLASLTLCHCCRGLADGGGMGASIQFQHDCGPLVAVQSKSPASDRLLRPNEQGRRRQTMMAFSEMILRIFNGVEGIFFFSLYLAGNIYRLAHERPKKEKKLSQRYVADAKPVRNLTKRWNWE